MVLTIIINDISIRLFIQKLNGYVVDSNTLELISLDEYLCYFKLSPPTGTMLGELIRDENNYPKVFTSVEDAERFTSYLLSSRLNLITHLPDFKV